MLTSHTKKKLIIGAALATLLASPAFAQSYTPSYGTGNVRIDGAAGVGTGAYKRAGIYDYAPFGSSAYAYVPDPGNSAGNSPGHDFGIESQR